MNNVRAHRERHARRKEPWHLHCDIVIDGLQVQPREVVYEANWGDGPMRGADIAITALEDPDGPIQGRCGLLSFFLSTDGHSYDTVAYRAAAWEGSSTCAAQ